MWKPGTDKPHSLEISANKGLSLSSSSASSSFQDAHSRNNNAAGDRSPPSPDHDMSSSPVPSSTKKKRLSGQTMNMRFMKRKTEADQNDTQRNSRRTSDGDQNLNGSRNQKGPLSAKDRVEVDIDMEIEEHDNYDNINHRGGAPSYNRQATSVDMYGVEGSIIGRRSFGGFNASIERSWKDSKAAATGRFFGDIGGAKKKISDEELMERYRPSSSQQQHQAVGNLNDKVNRRRKRKK
jgi:hypothetical protein